jgi:hypothetical protein
MTSTHLALQNAETIHRLVEQGELLLKTFHSEYTKDAAGVETEFARGELTGWRNTLHTVYSRSRRRHHQPRRHQDLLTDSTGRSAKQRRLGALRSFNPDP